MNGMKQSLGVALWFVFLTFPFVVVKVNTLKDIVEWRWMNMLWVAIGAFILSFVWRWAIARKEQNKSQEESVKDDGNHTLAFSQRLLTDPKLSRPFFAVVGIITIAFPLVFGLSQVNVMTLALIYVVLGLGLNVTVGLAGLLDLGYVAFFAVGAYTYGILNTQFGWGFWTCLPVGGFMGALFGILLGFPILRLRGDYLAIVTLGFGSIAKIVIENWEEVLGGAQGIANIARPGLFGVEMDITQVNTYIYYLIVLLVIFAIFITNRLKDSRIGRAWMALREDETACVAMGIDMAKTKLSAYAFGAFWAGLVGVVFATNVTYLHPNSFTFMESAIVLSIVVLGGMGSILGVIIAALVMILTPEYLRAFSEYRMLVFGLVMVLMMIFRPQGLISNIRKTYTHDKIAPSSDNGSTA